MKKTILTLIVILLVGVVGFLGYSFLQDEGNIGTWYSGTTTLVGSSYNLQSIPVKNTATTTVDQAFLDPPSSITQVVNTDGDDQLILAVSAKGGTATSTIFFQIAGSYDNSSFFNLSTTTQDTVYNATSSLMALESSRALEFDPGTATSTISKVIDTKGWKYLRFIFWGEDLSTDPLDYVQAWIQVIKTENTR